MKKYILLVEDDTELTEALASYLEREKYTVITVSTVKDAMHKLRNQAFFCVITDIRLASGSGEDLIDNIRHADEKDPNRKIPILVISGFLDRPLTERLQNQVSGALVKPFTLESLSAKLKAFS